MKMSYVLEYPEYNKQTIFLLAGVPGVALVNKVTINQKTL